MKRELMVAALAALGLCGRAVAAEGDAGAERKGAERPNFLFVYTDDQRWDAMGVVQKEMGEAGRFPWLRTPNMDRLAKEGVIFRNAFVVNSLCAPSRACFLSGQYNHANGVVNNHMEFPLGDVTSSGLLAKAGYDTAYFGKWHHRMQKERPGFEHVASYLGQGVYWDCPFNVDGKMTPTKGWVDDLATDYTIAYLKDHVKNHPGQPFDVVLGYKTCHDPREARPEDKELYEGEKIRPVPNLASWPPFLPREATTQGFDANRPVKDKKASEYRLDYFRCITSVDQSLGRLMDALDELGLSENTVVIFSSDNGYYMGEHHLNDKRSGYDESLRIPFVVRWPKVTKAGTAVEGMVLNIDLAPTLLDLAGVEVPKEMQGKSWKALLEGGTDAFEKWRHSFLFEYFYERGYASPATVGVRTDVAKLIEYPGHGEWSELYDLKKDPYETRNLYADPGAKELREKMEGELERQEKETGYRVPETADKFDPAKPGHF